MHRIYLDHAASTPISDRARASLCDGLAIYGNTSSIYQEGLEASRLLATSRDSIAKVLHTTAPQIYFVATGTESIDLAIVGTIDAYYKAITKVKNNLNQDLSDTDKPHIITSNIEHTAVLETLKKEIDKGRVTVSYIEADEWGILNIKKIIDEIKEQTILITIAYANSEIGTIQPIRELGRRLSLYKKNKKEKADKTREGNFNKNQYPYLHIDACQASNYLSLDVNSLRVDMMSLNSSKVYGPKGVAMLYIRNGVYISGVIRGGSQERGLRAGTEAIASVAGFATALSEAAECREAESARLLTLRDYLVQEIESNIAGAKLYGSFKDKERLSNNVNIGIAGITSEEMIIRLDAVGISVSHKSACASAKADGSYVLMAIGASRAESLSNIRVTMGRSTTQSDIDILVTEIKRISEKYGSLRIGHK